MKEENFTRYIYIVLAFCILNNNKILFWNSQRQNFLLLSRIET